LLPTLPLVRGSRRSNLTESFGCDSGDNQLTSLQPTGSNPFRETFSYNADGDRTGMSGTQSATYGYNQADELISFTQGSISASYDYYEAEDTTPDDCV